MKTVLRLLLSVLVLSTAACTCCIPLKKLPHFGAATGKKDPFSGKWEGQWVSAKHQNSSGKLLCQLKRLDESHYRADFKAYWLAFHGSYPVTLNTHRVGDELFFEGEHTLSKLYGGVYRYTGRATRKEFVADYSSSYDFGQFRMKRVH